MTTDDVWMQFPTPEDVERDRATAAGCGLSLKDWNREFISWLFSWDPDEAEALIAEYEECVDWYEAGRDGLPPCVDRHLTRCRAKAA